MSLSCFEKESRSDLGNQVTLEVNGFRVDSRQQRGENTNTTTQIKKSDSEQAAASQNSLPKLPQSALGRNSVAATKQTESKNYFVQILLLGDTGVGKSSLLHRYSEGEFASDLIGTAGVDHKLKNVEH